MWLFHMWFSQYFPLCAYGIGKKKSNATKKFLPTCEKPYNCGILLGQNITVPLARHTGNVARKFKEKNCCGVQLRLTHILSDTHTSNIYLTNTHSHTLTRIRPICKYRGVWMVLGRSWGKWRLLSACTCVCIQYKSKHVCLRLSTLEQYDESGYWLKGSLSFYQQIVPPTVVIIPMWTHTFTHSHAHREQQ